MTLSTAGGSGLVIDTSAVVSILLAEPGNEDLLAALDAADMRVMPAVTRVELTMVIEGRLREAGRVRLEWLLRALRFDIADVDADLVERTLAAWRRFGKGRHPAGLNFGDCFVYALADRTGLPVLCTGEDFAATDIDVVRPTLN